MKSKKGMSQIAPGTPSVIDVMAEDRKLRKVLVNAQIEKDILKMHPRTVPRIRFQVRVHEEAATSFPYWSDGQDS